MHQFLLIALGTLASEDLTCIAVGALVAQGRIGFGLAVSSCLTGIFLGDAVLFFCGRLAGGTILARWPFSRLIRESQIEKASEWITTQGRNVVLWSRFTPGLRLPTYVAAGALRTNPWAFLGYFLLAAGLWTPLLVGFSVYFNTKATGLLSTHSSYALVPMSLGLFGFSRIVANVKPAAMRWIGSKRWEFWPSWAIYAPLVPYLLFLAMRYRSLTLFTAANPGIFTGGFAGESKSQILGHLSKVEGAVASFEVIQEGVGDFEPDVFPIVLKPDQGERGDGVAIIRSPLALKTYLAHARGMVIAQEFVPGVEFGVFYCRYPNQSRGTILSITQKVFPSVTGDGRRTIGELIASDERARCIKNVYAASCKRPLQDIPALGEVTPLVEIGSHCRGAIFLNGARFYTTKVEAAIDRISHAHPGFYFGRYDVRAESIEAFQAGDFRVIELNGVSAEPTHIYDPSVSILAAYRDLMRHWRIAFEIGAMNRSLGAKATGVRTILRILRRRPQWNTLKGSRVQRWPPNSEAARCPNALL